MQTNHRARRAHRGKEYNGHVAKLLPVLTFLLIIGCQNADTGAPRPDSIKLRLGWQPPVAAHGQIIEVLKHSDILKRNGLHVEFFPFNYGSPEMEAALAGNLDAFFVGDQPASNLLARGAPWKIISRFSRGRNAIMVPIASPIQTVADLRTKKVAVPFGSVAHRDLIKAETEAGLDWRHDVENLNIDILELTALVQKGGNDHWGDIDAICIWDPAVTLFLQEQLARAVQEIPYVGVIGCSTDFLTRHPDSAAHFLKSVIEAWGYFAAHQTQVNEWYREDTGLPYSDELLHEVNMVEPNNSARSPAEINLAFEEPDLRSLEQSAKFTHQLDLSSAFMDLTKFIEPHHLEQARAMLKQQ
jgi:ABC-type nitrate/sulfonate/bicarbonate transport system substrate-binding protein